MCVLCLLQVFDKFVPCLKDSNSKVNVQALHVLVELTPLLKDYFNIRSGLLLLPMGFINEVHEPPFYYGAERPEVEMAKKTSPGSMRMSCFSAST